MAVLKGERVLLRPGRPEDADALVRIRKEPEVARRWGSAGIEEEIGEETTDKRIVERYGERIAY